MTTKLQLAMTADGHLVNGFLTGGNVNDISVANQWTEYGCYITEDKGYDSDKHRITLKSQNNTPIIPGRKNRIVITKPFIN